MALYSSCASPLLFLKTLTFRKNSNCPWDFMVILSSMKEEPGRQLVTVLFVTFLYILYSLVLLLFSPSPVDSSW